MGKISEALGDRVVKVIKTPKLVRYICTCVEGCGRTVTIEKMKHLPGRCKECAIKIRASTKGIARNKTTKEDWIVSEVNINNITSGAILKHKEKILYVKKRKDSHRFRYVFKCDKCGCETSPKRESLENEEVILCRVCSNEQKKKRPYERAYNKKKKICAKKGREFNLTYEDFFRLCEEKSCYYCNKEIKRKKYKGIKGSGSTSCFIDRKDSSIGYRIDNCVSCCWECNNIKGKWFTAEQFKMVRMIFDNDLDKLKEHLRANYYNY